MVRLGTLLESSTHSDGIGWSCWLCHLRRTGHALPAAAPRRRNLSRGEKHDFRVGRVSSPSGHGNATAVLIANHPARSWIGFRFERGRGRDISRMIIRAAGDSAGHDERHDFGAFGIEGAHLIFGEDQ